MIKKLRIKLIRVSMLSLFAVLLIIMGVVNALNYRNIAKSADTTLTYLAQNRGVFPDRFDVASNEPPKKPDDDWEPDDDPFDDDADDFFDDFFGSRNDRRIRLADMSPELQYESRYFSALIDSSGAVSSVDVGRIAAVDAETAAKYALAVCAESAQRGFFGSYRYAVADEDGSTRVIFLDCTRSLATFRTFLLASCGISLLGLALVFVLMLLVSGKVIRPISESYEKQKQFITDAGHEIKTPIAIISADAEVLELENGESEWIDDIRRQTQRLSSLTNDLIFLSRMEESDVGLAMIDFPFSDMAEECVQSFASLAKAQGKVFDSRIEPKMSYCGDEKSLRQLVNILLDNAIKYSTDGGSIFFSAEKSGKGVRLAVENTCENVTKEQTSRMFDRFYRGDSSRSSDKPGHGIGLSIAKAVTEAHKGKISASSDGSSLKITVNLP